MHFPRLWSAAVVAAACLASEPVAAQDSGLEWQLNNCQRIYDRMAPGCERLPQNNTGWYSRNGCIAHYGDMRDQCVQQAQTRDTKIRESQDRYSQYQQDMKQQRTANDRAREQRYNDQRKPQ